MTINRYSEHQYRNRPKTNQLYVLGKSAFIQESRLGWTTGLIFESGDLIKINTYSTKVEACNRIARDVVEYIGHSYQALNEGFSPDWLKQLSQDITEWHGDFFDLGILQTIQPYADGIELEYTDSQYSEELDDLGLDHTLDTDLYIDIVFRGIPEDTERLISLGLQDIPDDYEINIFVEYSGTNKSIFGFKYVDSKKWYFDQQDLSSANLEDNTVNGVIKWCITNLITRWVNSRHEKAMQKLVKLATSVKKSQD